MKKAVLWAAVCASFLGLASASYAADINGIWKNDGQTMIFLQEGGNIQVMCTYRGGSGIVTWYGQGSIQGNRVEYYLHHANTDKPGTYNHYHAFTVSSDGKTMNGTWGTVFQPVMGNWSLHRVGP
ncbi:MAG: hypothetical protein HPY65_17375 [Syntrophaceae bacterium]|nr:hypothetical protein [Syntrophaceae bacterium]